MLLFWQHGFKNRPFGVTQAAGVWHLSQPYSRIEKIPNGFYSTLRRALLGLDYQTYGVCVANFFKIEPQSGETIALDGKVLRGSYTIETGANRTESHLAIQLVTVYLVERGLILTPQQVDCKTNEINAIPPVLAALARRGVVFAFDALNTQKKLVS